jgi:hypothetical protein
MATYNQIAVPNTATLICAANGFRTRLIIVQHGGGNAAYLGNSTVTATTGLFLSSAAGTPVVFRHPHAVYGITASSTTTVSFYEETRT